MPTGDCLKALGAEGLWLDSVPLRQAQGGLFDGLRTGSPRTDSGSFGRLTVNGGASRAEEGGSETPPLRKKGPRTPG